MFRVVLVQLQSSVLGALGTIFIIRCNLLSNLLTTHYCNRKQVLSALPSRIQTREPSVVSQRHALWLVFGINNLNQFRSRHQSVVCSPDWKTTVINKRSDAEYHSIVGALTMRQEANRRATTRATMPNKPLLCVHVFRPTTVDRLQNAFHQWRGLAARPHLIQVRGVNCLDQTKVNRLQSTTSLLSSALSVSH